MDLSVANMTFQVVGSIVTVALAIGMTRQKITYHDEKLKAIDESIEKKFDKLDVELRDSFQKRDGSLISKTDDCDKRINACFRKVDEIDNAVTNLDKAIEKRATIKEVRDEFITRQELELRLKVIEQTTEATNKEVLKMEKQLESILHILQERN